MRKVLFGAAALVAAGMLAAGAQAQQDPQPVSVSLSGFFNSGFAAVSQDLDANDRGHAFRQDSEIHFSGSTTLDNGLTVGVRVELEGEQDNGDQIDEAFIWISGTFGRIVVGEDDSASGVMGIYPASAGHSTFGVIFPIAQLAKGGGVGQHGNFALGTDADDEKIAWYSPRVGGLAIGASYTPNSAGDGDDGPTKDNDEGEFSQHVGLGLNWAGGLGDSAVSVGFGYNQAQLEAPKGAVVSDRSDWAAGASVSMMGVTVSGNYTVDNRGMDDGDKSSLAVGATYGDLLPGTLVGVTFGTTEDEAADTTNSAVSFGARYTLGPGITLAGEIQFWDIEGAGDAADNQATVALMGTMISF